MSDEQDDEGRPPRVFVSYSHDSDDHRYKVRLLVEALRRSYVFAWFDQYVEDDRPPGNWPNWMRQELTKADYVVMVCTETYTRRVEDEEKPGQGFGARWEGAIISNASYRAQRLADPNRYMPVVFQSEDRRHIPYFVEQATHYLVDPETEQGVDQLVRRIKRQPLLVPIPLGGGLPERPAQALERQTFDDVSAADSVRAVVTRSPSWPSEEDSGKAKTAFVRTAILKWETLDEEQREEYVRNLTAAERQVLYDSLSESDRSRWDDLTLESSSEYTRAAAIARRLSTKGVKPHPLGEVPFPEAQAMQVQPTDLELEGLLFDALVAAQQHSEDSDVFFLYLGRVSAQLGKLIGRQMNRKIQVEIWDAVMRQDGPVARCLAGPEIQPLTVERISGHPDFGPTLRTGYVARREPAFSADGVRTGFRRHVTYIIPTPAGREERWMGWLRLLSIDPLGEHDDLPEVVGQHTADRLSYILAAVPPGKRRARLIV